MKTRRERDTAAWYQGMFGGSLAVLLACLVALPSQAFKPTAEFGHVGIDRDAITPITRRSTAGKTLRFSDRAIEQLRDATAGVDEIFSSRGELTTPAAHCDDELMTACSQRLVTIKNAIIANLSSESRDGSEARAQAGRALHTLQDFYAHSNWVNNPGPANTTFNAALGRTALPGLAVGTATCVDDFFDRTLVGAGLTSTTTGYFKLEPPAGKCAHGVLSGVGINKDQPGRPFHGQARAVAVQATTDFINQILDAPGVAGNDEAIMAFMDIRPTLGFVVDDTGSMGSEISGVRSSVQQIIGAVAGTENAPGDYLLVRYGDPDVGSPLVTTDPNVLQSAVNALRPNGGGDCPELSQSALISAISRTSSGGKLYLYSDASAKDSGLVGNVTAAANAKRININYIITGTCSPVDPAYVRGAQETGGQLFFISPSEVGSIFKLIEPSLAGDLRPLLILNDQVAPGTQSFSVPVDSTVTRVTFSISADSLTSVKLFRPSGAEVLATDPGVTFTALSTARIFTIAAPPTGQWDVTLSGSGDLSLSVLGNSAIDFADFSFMQRRGREEHEGLFPLDGQPLLDEDTMARARLFGPFANARFERVALDGTDLGAINLTLGGDVDVAADEYAGSLLLPAQPFRVFARGVDANGAQFQRAFPNVFRGQTVQVEAVSPGGTLPLGTVSMVGFRVTNRGAADTFRVTATDDARFVSRTTPSIVALGPGESALVDVEVSVPAETGLAFDVLTVFARSTSNPESGNSTRTGVLIGVADADDDGIPDSADSCPASDLLPTIVIDGCDSRVDNLLELDGCTWSDQIGQIAGEAGNHGQFVSGVAILTDYLKSDGVITGAQKGAIQSCAARSSIP